MLFTTFPNAAVSLRKLHRILATLNIVVTVEPRCHFSFHVDASQIVATERILQNSGVGYYKTL
jgi:hypothetical protein